MVKIGIAGASGYTGLELIRLLAGHPEAELTVLTSETFQGQNIAEVFPSLNGVVDLKLRPLDDSITQDCSVLFLALPHIAAMEKLPVYPSAWCWTDEAENVLEGMSWLRSDSKANAASVAPELESWIMQNPNSWLIIDGRGNRIPGAGGRLEELLRNLATTVVMIVDEIDKAHPFPAWEFPL